MTAPADRPELEYDTCFNCGKEPCRCGVRPPAADRPVEHYDEDAQVCRCGHTFREHTGKPMGYACMASIAHTTLMCDCRRFAAADRPVEDSELESALKWFAIHVLRAERNPDPKDTENIAAARSRVVEMFAALQQERDALKRTLIDVQNYGAKEISRLQAHTLTPKEAWMLIRAFFTADHPDDHPELHAKLQHIAQAHTNPQEKP